MFMRYRKLYPGVFVLVAVALTAGVGLTAGVRRRSALPTEGQLLAAGASSAGENYCSMQRGRALLVTRCTECHRLFFPCEYPPAVWPGLIQGMGRKSNFSLRQIGDMTRYMVAASRLTHRPFGAGRLQGVLEQTADPEMVKHGRALAEGNCTDCHRYYGPSEYAPAVWPRIVESMGEMSRLSHDDQWAIATYMVEAASRHADAGE